MALREDGSEVLDDTPLEIPMECKRPESLASMIGRLIQSQLYQRAVSQEGMETIEEADDFDVEGDDFSSPYELRADQEFDEALAEVERGFVPPPSPKDSASPPQGGVSRGGGLEVADPDGIPAPPKGDGQGS